MAKTVPEQRTYWQRRKAEEEERVLTAADQNARDAHRRLALSYALRLADEPGDEIYNEDKTMRPVLRKNEQH